jgi:hypothetical protein
LIFGKVSNAARKIIRSKWYRILGLLWFCVLVFFLLGIKVTIGLFVLGIVTIVSFKPESFFAAGIAASVIMGVFLAARVQWLALDCAKIAFALVTVGTLLGAWRLWTTPEPGEGSPGDVGE